MNGIHNHYVHFAESGCVAPSSEINVSYQSSVRVLNAPFDRLSLGA